MNVLFVAPYVPSPIRVRAYEWLRHLSAQGHRLTLVAPSTSEGDEEAQVEWKDRGVRVVSRRLKLIRSLANCLAAVPTRRPLQAAFCWHPALAKAAMRELTERSPDVVHVEHLRASRYGWALHGEAMRQGAPVIWDSVDSISALFQQAREHRNSGKGRLFARVDLHRTQRWEGALVGRFARTLVVAARDRESLVSLAGGEAAIGHRVEVLTNGVDRERFRPRETLRDPATIVFSGKMSYHANLTAVRFLLDEIMPCVWRSRPDARLCLVGAFPGRELQRIADPRIEVTGFVEDLGARLARSTVAVAPMIYSTGVQNKVLEAMACGTPVVATPSAIEGLGPEIQRKVAVASDGTGLAAALVALLGSHEERARLSTSGRRYVESSHSWERLAERLSAVYEEERARLASRQAP